MPAWQRTDSCVRSSRSCSWPDVLAAGDPTRRAGRGSSAGGLRLQQRAPRSSPSTPPTVTGHPRRDGRSACSSKGLDRVPSRRHSSPSPASRRRWDVSEDGLTYTFHLRDDARVVQRGRRSPRTTSSGRSSGFLDPRRRRPSTPTCSGTSRAREEFTTEVVDGAGEPNAFLRHRRDREGRPLLTSTRFGFGSKSPTPFFLSS